MTYAAKNMAFNRHPAKVDSMEYGELLPMLANGGWDLTLILLTWTIWRAPTNASKWRMGFNPYPANVDNMASSYQC